MTPTAFSRFFKLRTGRSISDYVIDIRPGHASRQLVDSTTSVAEICYECGFNNVSNFNRIFKKKKGNSPRCSARSISITRCLSEIRLLDIMINQSSTNHKESLFKYENIIYYICFRSSALRSGGLRRHCCKKRIDRQ